MIMISNQEAPLLKLLISVIVCGAERQPPPRPFFLVFLSTRPSARPGLLPQTGFFHLLNTYFSSSCHMYMNDHSFSTSDFGETEPDVRLWLFKFVQHLDAPVAATFFFYFIFFIKVLIHHKGLLYVCSAL